MPINCFSLHKARASLRRKDYDLMFWASHLSAGILPSITFPHHAAVWDFLSTSAPLEYCNPFSWYNNNNNNNNKPNISSLCGELWFNLLKKWAVTLLWNALLCIMHRCNPAGLISLENAGKIPHHEIFSLLNVHSETRLCALFFPLKMSVFAPSPTFCNWNKLWKFVWLGKVNEWVPSNSIILQFFEVGDTRVKQQENMDNGTSDKSKLNATHSKVNPHRNWLLGWSLVISHSHRCMFYKRNIKHFFNLRD